MQVILMEKVVNLGGLGDVVKVKDGYARNFLIPQGQGQARDRREPEGVRSQRAELEKRPGRAARRRAGRRPPSCEGLMRADHAARPASMAACSVRSANADIAEALDRAGFRGREGRRSACPRARSSRSATPRSKYRPAHRRDRDHHRLGARRAVISRCRVPETGLPVQPFVLRCGAATLLSTVLGCV